MNFKLFFNADSIKNLRLFSAQTVLKKESIIATKAACQAAGHLGKVPIFLLFFNVSYIEDWSVLLPLIIAVYVGTKIGKLLLGKLPEILFQNLFKSVLTIIAIRLILVQVW